VKNVENPGIFVEGRATFVRLLAQIAQQLSSQAASAHKPGCIWNQAFRGGISSRQATADSSQRIHLVRAPSASFRSADSSETHLCKSSVWKRERKMTKGIKIEQR
jgi:hypothetical protein